MSINEYFEAAIEVLRESDFEELGVKLSEFVNHAILFDGARYSIGFDSVSPNDAVKRSIAYQLDPACKGSYLAYLLSGEGDEELQEQGVFAFIENEICAQDLYEFLRDVVASPNMIGTMLDPDAEFDDFEDEFNDIYQTFINYASYDLTQYCLDKMSISDCSFGNDMVHFTVSPSFDEFSQSGYYSVKYALTEDGYGVEPINALVKLLGLTRSQAIEEIFASNIDSQRALAIMGGLKPAAKNGGTINLYSESLRDVLDSANQYCYNDLASINFSVCLDEFLKRNMQEPPRITGSVLFCLTCPTSGGAGYSAAAEVDQFQIDLTDIKLGADFKYGPQAIFDIISCDYECNLDRGASKSLLKPT